MSADLLSGSLGAPQSLNRYAYVTNDPVNFVDPQGLLMLVCELLGTCGNAGIGFDEGIDFGDAEAGTPLIFEGGKGGRGGSGNGRQMNCLAPGVQGPPAPGCVPQPQPTNPPSVPKPQPPELTPQQLRCVAAAASSGALAVNAGLNEAAAAFAGEVTPVAAILHAIAVGEGIGSGGFEGVPVVVEG